MVAGANDQDIPDRRVYVVRARPELLKRVAGLGDSDLREALARPYVVMTEELPFERFLEGWRPVIRRVSKIEFLEEVLERCSPFPSDEFAMQALGGTTPTEELFDRWWTAEEAEYIELERSSWRA